MSGLTALINGTLYTGDTILRGNAVMIENGKITGLPSAAYVPKDAKTVDMNGDIVAPGFIDVQVNGGGGVSFSADPTPEALETIAKAHERAGTLHWCPAVLPADMDSTLRSLEAVKDGKARGLGVLGAHMVGPYISKDKSGGHDSRFIRHAEDEEIGRLLDAAGRAVSLITLAPESAGELHILRFTGAGIRVFLGYTDAPCVIAEASFAAGVCGVTRLYNAMSQLTAREPGAVGAALSAKHIWAGIVADGAHVDWRSIKIAKQIKKERLFLVTDAKDDVVCTMPDAIRNLEEHCDLALDEALRMAAAYPAEMLGVADRLGYIRPGYQADLVFLNQKLSVTGIMRGGEARRF